MEFKLVEGRSINVGEKVEIYFNIQKGGFSIVSRDKNNPDNGKVVAYSPFVHIEKATFHINQKKLAKIREMKRKTVYAVVKGIYLGHNEIEDLDYIKGYCNPYKTGKFIERESEMEVKTADRVYFYDKYFSFLKKQELALIV